MTANHPSPAQEVHVWTCLQDSLKTRGTTERTNILMVAHPAFTTSRQPGTMRPQYSAPHSPGYCSSWWRALTMTMWCPFCEHEEYESHRAVEPSTHTSEKSLGKQAALWARMRVSAGSPWKANTWGSEDETQASLETQEH